MSNRITKSILEARVTALNAALGTSFRLDREWKGWSITGTIPGSKGLSQPFGANIYSASELYHMINFALRAIQIDREGPHHAAYWPKDKEASND